MDEIDSNLDRLRRALRLRGSADVPVIGHDVQQPEQPHAERNAPADTEEPAPLRSPSLLRRVKSMLGLQ